MSAFLPVEAAAEVPEPFDLPAMADDYRIVYSMETGIWGDHQTTIHHRVSLQIPLWSTAIGAMLPYSHAFGEVNDAYLGNMRLYLQWFRRFSLSAGAGVRVGAGLDGYIPTATTFINQEMETSLVTVSTPAESALHAPELTFAFRPRLHAAGELWIFSLQGFAAASVQFEGNEATVAFEWGAAIGAAILEWFYVLFEASGISWLGEAPYWMEPRSVTLGGGVRFHLPNGFRTGLWIRGAVIDPESPWGWAPYVGIDLMWCHDRDWILF